jgi:hypothetical protein
MRGVRIEPASPEIQAQIQRQGSFGKSFPIGLNRPKTGTELQPRSRFEKKKKKKIPLKSSTTVFVQ